MFPMATSNGFCVAHSCIHVSEFVIIIVCCFVLVVLSLCCCMQASSTCEKQGLPLVSVHEILVAVASLVVGERGL